MWKRHLFKHVYCTLSSGLIRPIHHHRHFPLASLSTTYTLKSPYHFTNPSPSSSSSSSSLRFFTNSVIIASSSVSLPRSSSSSAAEPSTYLSVRIRCPKNVADALSESLLCFGASSVSTEEVEATGPQTSNEAFIDSIFFESQDIKLCLSQASDSIGLKEIPSYEVKVGEPYDWVQKTQEYFLPVQVAQGLWIVPEWKSPLDIHAINIILNPGLAFGTGEHPTTKLCLLLLRGLIKGGECFLDYGTGSGILAIAALKFGAALSVGFDIDPQAITSASHNASLNDIKPGRMELYHVPGKICSPLEDEVSKEQGSYATDIISETEKYDVVVANILLNPLLELADNIVSYAKPGAVVGLSGILAEQVCSKNGKICFIYCGQIFSVLRSHISVRDGWLGLYKRKKENNSE
ncbi:hypothetical protein Tsubulata_006445 [Turnera subulata]|uniref:ETFB lysine methyltransferase n=1 Tax=Turnera subulata TaxID=218843 RepID=A0A9Q0G2M8_9ROSI|nr:hypothetical protein Tsubulata_006445 [Turnera subulata]